MKILVAVDRNPYSVCAVEEVARLARNTLANVTLLGVVSRKEARNDQHGHASTAWGPAHPLAKALRQYRERFLSHFGDEDSPYVNREFDYELIEVTKGVWQELCVCRSARKSLKVRTRLGHPVKQILAESVEDDSDLIVVGCSEEKLCAWEGDARVPERIATGAACSVLVVKEEKNVKKIVCCLDQDRTSQQSLEMINQMVSIHHADLEVVGISDGEELKSEVEKKMNTILKYYVDRQINPYIKVVPLASLEAFISEEAGQGLMALWMGKKSVLENVFPRSKVNRLIKASHSSVLILR
jgi:nucleotide-binding universal stress UspA family protein